MAGCGGSIDISLVQTHPSRHDLNRALLMLDLQFVL